MAGSKRATDWGETLREILKVHLMSEKWMGSG